MDFITRKEKGYSLVDSGDLQRLERFGETFLVRPEPQALWPKSNPSAWLKSDGILGKNGWSFSKNSSQSFECVISDISAKVEIGKGRNIGIFPEHAKQWKALENLCVSRTARRSKVKVMNLFAHTGLASIACAKGGAEVTHVDSSRMASSAAKEAAAENGVSDSIRFITDDALSFLKREARRGNQYDLIILDPPVFGRGSQGQVFKIEEKIEVLLQGATALLSQKPLGILLNGYASEYSHISYANLLSAATGMETLSGILGIEEENGRFVLPLGIWAFAAFSSEAKEVIMRRQKVK